MSWKGRSAGSISSCSTCDKTHWARQPIFQPPGTFFLQRITKNVWSCLLLSRMMDPSTQHKRKPLGKVYHQHHPYHSSPRFIIKVGNLLISGRRCSCAKRVNVHSCFQIYLHFGANEPTKVLEIPLG